MRRRDFLIGTSLAGLAGEAAAQPVPLGFRRTLGPNGNAYGPISGGLTPTIDLNFITAAASFTGGSALDSRVTYSRADTVAAASYTDSTGLLRYGPTNITFPSGNLTTVWTATAATITAAAGTAPDGTNAMNRLADTATTAIHFLSKTNTIVGATVYTLSIYAQAAENRYLQLGFDDGAGVNGVYATFDLTGGTITGVVTARGTATNINASMTAISGSIYRCSITGATNSTTTGRSAFLTSVIASPGYAPSYVGNASNGLLIWGAQLEANNAPTQYVATTGAALSGPRFDYSPPTVTNFIRNSTMGGGAAGVYPTNWTESHNTAITPTIVGTGTESGIPYVDIRFNGAATAGNNNIFVDGTTVPIQALNGQTWTQSVYLRIVGGSTANLSTVNLVNQQRDASLVSLGALSTNVMASLNGNALSTNRFTWTTTIVQAATANLLPFLQINPTTATIDITLRIGAPQLEQAASANTFVPTYGTFAGSGGTLRGLLIEEARTNLAFPSNLPATLFTASASTLTATQGAAPDGTNTMARLAEAATTATHYANKTFTVTASAVYTFSLYAQAQQDTFLQLFYDDSTAVNGCYVNFNLTTGVISQAVAAFGAGTATNAAIQSVGNGIYRCSVTGVATTSVSGRVGVVLAQVGNAGFATSFAGSTANGLLIWGAQFELGSIPTSYIPTVGASQARTADIATMALVPPTSYTVAGECMVPVVGPSGSGVTQGIATIDDGTTANRTVLRLNNAFMQAVSIAASVTTGNVLLAGLSANTVMKSAYVSNGSASTLTLGFGGTLQTPVSGAQPTGLTTMRFGVGQPGALFLDGWLRRVRYYTSALSSAQLTQITT